MTDQRMNVELLYFDGCPSYEKLLPRLRALLDGAGAGDALQCRLYRTEAGLEHVPPEAWIREALERADSHG